MGTAIARKWERNETARRRGLTTNGVSRLDAPVGDERPEDDVAALSLLVQVSAGALPERVRERSRNE